MSRKSYKFRVAQLRPRGCYLKTKAYAKQYKHFLQKLRRARKEAFLTQTQAAALLGQPQPFLCKCETGERRVDAVELAHFARIYNKPITYFVDVE